MKKLSLLILLFCVYSKLTAEFLSFSDEMNRAKESIKIGKSRLTPASSELGALYGSVSGQAETVKFFINEEFKTGKTKNIKFLWNEWSKDRGYGIQADKKEALLVLEVVCKLYAPEKKNELKEVFLGSKNVSITTSAFLIEYTFHEGPAINERMIRIREINPMSDVLNATRLEKLFRDISKYSRNEVNIDMNPTNEGSYKSYYVEGENRDKFWLEIHNNGTVKIKAAYNGKYPFRYIGTGRWK